MATTAVGSISEQQKLRFEQQARAALPFNPVDGIEIMGQNITRLKDSMEVNGWNDFRFVTKLQATANGWTIRPRAEGVETVWRDATDGAVSNQLLFNAANVRGMPTLVEMLAMPETEFLKMQGRELALEDPEKEEELSIGPAPGPELAVDTKRAGPSPAATPAVASGGQSTGRFAALAPYWLDGLHNFEGIALANEINEAIKQSNLALDREAIARLLAVYPRARGHGIEIVDESKYLNDPHRKANVSEPRSLLGGDLVRDKDGSYRPKAGGLTVLQDLGSSVVLKTKSSLAYRGAMELAIAKGWKAIELKGKPAMLADAWLEAKLLGLEVVNYAPTEKDRTRYAERLAEQSQRKAAESSKAAEAAPETVEVRPFIDAKGEEKTARVTYTVSQTAGDSAKFDSPSDAAKVFAAIATGNQPVVVRTVTRVDGTVREDIVAGIAAVKPGSNQLKADAAIVDHEFNTALAEVKGHQEAVAPTVPSLAALASTTLAQEPAFSALVDHGPAKYLFKDKNKLSYFATVRNAGGQEETIWGLDLERSLKESGAKIGDSISLKEVGAKPVTVEEPQGDGTTITKGAQRITWETTVHGRTVEQAQPALASVAQLTAVSKGQHIGPITAVKDGMIEQKTGRDPGSLVWHSIANLNGITPKVGEVTEISYSKGKGTVKDRAKGLEQDGAERGVGR